MFAEKEPRDELQEDPNNSRGGAKLDVVDVDPVSPPVRPDAETTGEDGAVPKPAPVPLLELVDVEAMLAEVSARERSGSEVFPAASPEPVERTAPAPLLALVPALDLFP